jgi:hypothetical protein
MADYHSPTVVQPTIPNVDMTPLERLLLTHIFKAEADGDGLYFFAEAGPSGGAFELAVDELRAAIAQSTGIASRAHANLTNQNICGSESHFEIDSSATPCEFIFQDIVRRSPTLKHITVDRPSRVRRCVPTGSAAWPC